MREPTAPNAAMAIRFQIEHDHRGIGESRRWAKFQMRALVIISVSLLLIAGCKPNSPQKVQAKPENPQQRLKVFQERVALFATRADDVLVRSVTPYDSDPPAREAYLEYFYAGYRLSIGGTNMTCCLLDVPHRQARVTGWYDGQWAGGRAWSSNQFIKDR
jgi:hypothetical protein